MNLTLLKKYETLDISKVSEKDQSTLQQVKKLLNNFEETNEAKNKVGEQILDQVIKLNPDAVKKPQVVAQQVAKAKTVSKAKKATKAKKPATTTAKTSGNNIMSVAKEIQKEGESWKDAMERAKQVLKERKEVVVEKKKTELEKLYALVKTKKELQGFANSDIRRDSVRDAKPIGARVVTKEGFTSNQHGDNYPNKLGRKYWETRDRHADRLAPNYPKDMPLLASGGGVGEKHFVGEFNEQQLRKGEDKIAIAKAQKETGLTYIQSKMIKKSGKPFMQVYLISLEDYVNSNEFADGGEIKKLETSLLNAEKKYRKAILSEQVGIISPEELKREKTKLEDVRAKVNEWYATKPIGKKMADGGTMWTKEKAENEIAHYKNLLKNIDKYPDYNKKNVEKIISEYEEKLAKNEFADGGMMNNMSVHNSTDFFNTPVYANGGGIDGGMNNLTMQNVSFAKGGKFKSFKFNVGDKVMVNSDFDYLNIFYKYEVPKTFEMGYDFTKPVTIVETGINSFNKPFYKVKTADGNLVSQSLPQELLSPAMSSNNGSDVKIKDWYMKTYPTDDLGEELNDEVTFEDLWNEDYKKYNIYQVMGVGDSIIRERLFERLAEIKGVSYDVVYRKLFSSDGFYANGGEVKSVVDALFEFNEKRGKLNTSFGAKTKDGITALIENDNYTSEEIAKAIFFSNNKKEKISTGYGDKSFFGLQDMIERARSKEYANGGSLPFMTDPNFGNFQNTGSFELGGAFMMTDLAGHTGGSDGLGNPMPLNGVSGTYYTGLVGETGAMSSGELFARGGNVSNEDKLLKELHKLQRDLNSGRLSTYREGDTSEEEMARQRERESKLARFNEVLKTLRESDKYAKGGGIKSDRYDGKSEKIVAELKKLKGGLNNEPPYVYQRDGLIYVSAENGDNYADYDEYLFIDEKLENLADKYDTYWDWENAGAIVLFPLSDSDEDEDEYASGGSLGKALYVAYSSYFDSNKYDEEKIMSALKSIGAKNIHLEDDGGMPNQPEVVVFNGSKRQAEDALNEAFDTDYILIYEKDWRTKKMADGGDVLPPSKTYGENIHEAINKFNISDSEARKKYGQYTISQWDELLGKKMSDGSTFTPNVSSGTEFMNGVYADGGAINGELNKKIQKLADVRGFEIGDWATSEYDKIMTQALVESLTDANFHDEAKEVVVKAEGKTKWSDELYKSEYFNPDEEVSSFAREVARICEWDGDDIVNAYFFITKMAGSKVGNMIEDLDFLMGVTDRFAKGGSVDDSVIDELFNGYASAVLFTETDSDSGEPLDSEYSISDFDKETVTSSKKMLAEYYSKNKEAIEESELDLDTIGNDIWYTRSGQGAGFFDHSLDSEVEEKLTKGAKALGEYPSVETYDGKISVRGGKVFAKGGSVDASVIDELFSGYASAVLFTETDSDSGEPLDSEYSISDFDKETVTSSKKMLAEYYSKNKEAIEESELDLDTIGNDIWYTRSGQGAGFFDHSLDSEVEEKLTKGAKALGEYPSVETYDGKISVRGGKVFAKGGGVSGARFKFDIGDKVMIDDRGYLTSFTEFDLSKPAEIIDRSTTKMGGKTYYFYKVKMADGRTAFNQAEQSKLTLVEKGSFAKGGFVGNVEFNVGDTVWQKDEKRYATVMNNYGDPINGDYGELRLDTTGNTLIFTSDKDYNTTGYNLIKVGEKGDTGKFTPEVLADMKASANRLIESRKQGKDKEGVAYYQEVYKRLLDGEFDSMVGGAKATASNKKGSIDYTYVPNKDVKELSVVLKGELKKLMGSDILDGVYVKNSVKSATKVDVNAVFAKILKDAKEAKSGKTKMFTATDLKKLNLEMVQKLVEAGYTEQQIRNIIFGYAFDNEIVADSELEYDKGIFSYEDTYIKSKIEGLVEAQKNKEFAVGIEYPDFDWQGIIKEYKISSKPKDITEKQQGTSGSTENYYEVFVGDNIVIGHNYGYKWLDANGKVLSNYMEEDKKVSDPTKQNAWQKEREQKAGFNGGWWTIISSKIEIIDDVLKTLLAQKGSYCKEIQFYDDSLPKTLKENKIAFADGGELNKDNVKVGDVLVANTGVEVKVVEFDPKFGGRIRAVRLDEYATGKASQFMPLNIFTRKTNSKMADGGFMNNVYAKGGSLDGVEKSRIRTFVNSLFSQAKNKISNDKGLSLFVISNTVNATKDSLGNPSFYLGVKKVKNSNPTYVVGSGFLSSDMLVYESYKKDSRFLETESIVEAKKFLTEKVQNLILHLKSRNVLADGGGVGDELYIYLTSAEDDGEHLVYALYDKDDKIIKSNFEDTTSAKKWAKENGYIAVQYADGGFMNDVYAKGGELQGKFLAEIKVPYNFEYVVEDEYEFSRFLSKALTNKFYFGNGVWGVKIVKPLFEKDYSKKIVVEIEIPAGVTQGGGLDKFDVLEFMSKTLTKKWFGNGVWGVDVVKSFADGGMFDDNEGFMRADNENNYRYPEREVYVETFDEPIDLTNKVSRISGKVDTLDEPIDLRSNVSRRTNDVVIRTLDESADLNDDKRVRARMSYNPKDRNPDKLLSVNPRAFEFIKDLPMPTSNTHKND